MTTQQLRNKLEQKKGARAEVRKKIAKLTDEIDLLTGSLQNHEKAREIIKLVGKRTQEQLSFHISDITSLALSAVFNDPYELVVDFVDRRNKTECDLLFERDGKRIKPIDAAGGGTVDIATFALRIASWSMKNPHSRNTIIMDEPMKNVSAEYQEKASAMIKDISKKLGIQFIIVTHSETLTSYADRIFKTSIRKGITKIETL
jgi:DNA repair exonuclease SbcCD ATPase subunit